MSNPFVNPVTPPTPPTDAQKAAMVAERVINTSGQLFNQLVDQYNRQYNEVWKHPHPELVVAGMGTKAQLIFAASGGLAAYLNSLGAGVVATMPNIWDYVANEDGSVTLTKKT